MKQNIKPLTELVQRHHNLVWLRYQKLESYSNSIYSYIYGNPNHVPCNDISASIQVYLRNLLGIGITSINGGHAVKTSASVTFTTSKGTTYGILITSEEHMNTVSITFHKQLNG